ncbi:hypothetical protein Q1695_009696 [Nippostrongylus brasiliensis]|nr:hypothetical protein Q1695_009696 [Nippostrongylus brasiliensis]
MTTAVKWRAAFKEIYGHTPTKTDYGLAPQQVREEHKAECPPSPAAVVEEQPRKGGVRLKRPNLDAEGCSPLKRRPPKARRLCLDGPAPLRTSPRKNPKPTPSTSGILSPVKSFNRRITNQNTTTALKEIQPVSSSTAAQQLLLSPLKKTLPVFKSLFDTPEKGQATVWGEVSAKRSPAPPRTGATPIRSPRKPLVHREVLTKNAEYLLMPTPEKRETKEVLEPFLAEEVTKKKPVTAKKGLAVAFSAEKGRVIERPFKRPKKNDGNFVRINMKKKSFTRGKVSAEQKRKMRRKQNWKRRFGGGGK